MTTDSATIKPFTDLEIEQLREVPGDVLLSHDEVRAIIARFDELRLRVPVMAGALMQVRSSCVRWGDAGLVEAIDAAIAGVPDLPKQPEHLSPTVAITVLARAVMALCRSNPGDAWQHMRQLGELGQEVR